MKKLKMLYFGGKAKTQERLGTYYQYGHTCKLCKGLKKIFFGCVYHNQQPLTA